VGCGTAGTVGIAWWRVRGWFQAPASAPGIADRVTNRLNAQLSKELELTPEEAAKIKATLDGTAVNLKQARVHFAREVTTELRSSFRRIAADLPPDKQAEFRRIVRERFHRIGVDLPDFDGPAESQR
jgi:hypothetical protein